MGSRRRPPDCQSATLEIWRPISFGLGGIRIPRKPDVGESRERSSCPFEAPNAPQRNKAGESASKAEAAKLLAAPAMPTVISAAKLTSRILPPPNLNVAWAGRGSTWRTHFPQQKIAIGHRPKTRKVGRGCGVRNGHAVLFHANQLISSFQRRREGLPAIAVASLGVSNCRCFPRPIYPAT